MPWAYRFVFYHLGGNRADAEDLCSDILMTAARSIKKYDATRGTLDIWMLGIARHRLARFRRRHKIELVLTPEVIDDAGQDGSSMEERVITRNEVDRVLFTTATGMLSG
ncbi:MAG: sigma factor [Armatimonadota bacterium]